MSKSQGYVIISMLLAIFAKLETGTMAKVSLVGGFVIVLEAFICWWRGD